MAWVRVNDELLEPLMRFLGPLEAGCVSFTEKLVHRRRLALPADREYTLIARLERGERVTGAILQSQSGLYYPVLDPGSPVVEADAVRRLSRSTRRIYSIMGRSGDVRALEDAFRRPPLQYLEYHLMAQADPPPELPLPRVPRELRIREACERDARRLFDIQKKYEIEEVLLPGNTFSPTAAMHHLKQTLRDQVVLVAELDGTPVGKANTNARGVFFDQIGGVFTERALRSRGIATALMLRLLERLASESKNASLFVKKDNAPALRMYRNIGFAVEDEFRISYYR
ncbi:MAG: GNAT family N-acetyltransferase [Spirochaetota bacterium]